MLAIFGMLSIHDAEYMEKLCDSLNHIITILLYGSSIYQTHDSRSFTISMQFSRMLTTKYSVIKLISILPFSLNSPISPQSCDDIG